MLGKSVLTGHATTGWLITKISLHRTTKTFHAGDAFKGHEIAEDILEDNYNSFVDCFFYYVQIVITFNIRASSGPSFMCLGPSRNANDEPS